MADLSFGCELQVGRRYVACWLLSLCTGRPDLTFPPSSSHVTIALEIREAETSEPRLDSSRDLEMSGRCTRPSLLISKTADSCLQDVSLDVLEEDGSDATRMYAQTLFRGANILSFNHAAVLSLRRDVMMTANSDLSGLVVDYTGQSWSTATGGQRRREKNDRGE